MIDFEALRQAPVTTAPFTHFICPSVLHPADLVAARADFPAIAGTGIYPVDETTGGPGFQNLVEDIRSERMARVMSDKLGLDLTSKPLLVSVRGHCHKRDGQIHTDSKDKIATVLLYLNEPWDRTHAGERGGRLRFLRGPGNIDDMIAEVPPDGGTLVAFKRSECSWHGHLPYEGPRQYLMFNWLASHVALAKNVARHQLSSKFKSIAGIAGLSRNM